MDLLTYLGSEPLVRNTRNVHQFQVGITNKAYALYDVVGLGIGKSNYEFLYFYEKDNETNRNETMLLARWDVIVTGSWLMSGASTLIVVNITQTMEFVGCAETSYLCVLVQDADEASFTETDLLDNLLCTDITIIKECLPGACYKDHLDQHSINN